MKEVYDSFKRMLVGAQTLVKPNLYKEWVNYLLKDNDKVKDASMTYSCLAALKERNITYNELQDYLKTFNNGKTEVDFVYPIVKASNFSVYGKELQQECVSKFGNTTDKDELQMMVEEAKKQRKKRR